KTPHHLPEEMRGLHAIVDLVLPVEKVALVHDDHRRLLPLRVLAKGGKVMASLEELRRAAHRREIEPVANPPDEPLVEGGAASRDPVKIRPGDSSVARLKSGRRLLRVQPVDAVPE